jgi:hypothetical protein
MDKVLEDNWAKTEQGILREMNYVIHFKEHAAQIMVDVLHEVNTYIHYI